eukprot:403348061
MQGSFEFVKFLIEECGSNVNSTRYFRMTPLQIACLQNKHDIIELLLKHNASPCSLVNIIDTQVMDLTKTENVRIVYLLFKKGAVYQDKNGQIDKILIDKQPKIVEIIEEFECLKRACPVLKLQQLRNESQNYPKEFLKLNSNIFKSLISDYI